MAWNHEGLWCILVITCGIFQQGWALSCYNCTESDSNFCGNNFNKNEVDIVHCQEAIDNATSAMPDNMYACMFLKEIDNISGTSTFMRRCSLKIMNDSCKYIQTYHNKISKNIKSVCRQCETDLCNSSTPEYVNSLNLAVLITVYFTLA